MNSHREMAAAFMAAGFACDDVTMSDLMDQGIDLNQYHGLACCGGFSYGDVLGAGVGWAKVILENTKLTRVFMDFFERTNTFTLGACNGCQFLSQLNTIIPGADHFPRFKYNQSEQYEARLVLTRVEKSHSILLHDMNGSILPIVVSHAEGRASFEAGKNTDLSSLIALRYVDDKAVPTQRYPYNPNGSDDAVAGLTSRDGRVTIMMPHPERVHRTVQYSWAPRDWGKMSPWFKLFCNAKSWLA